MARESCIQHEPRSPFIQVRYDYWLLMHKDTASAAILALFEYWANAAIANEPDCEVNPWVGTRKIKDFQEMLFGIASDKHIRLRLKKLVELNYIQTEEEKGRGAVRHVKYRFMVENVQKDLKKISKDVIKSLQIPETEKITRRTKKASKQHHDGQLTVDNTAVNQPSSRRSNNHRHGGQITDARRSIDRATIYKENKEVKQEEDNTPLTPQGGDCGSEPQAIIAEIVEEVKPVIETGEDVSLIQPSLVVQNESISGTTKDLSLGSNISADENHSQFVPLVGKDLSTGRPYNPWIGQLVNTDGVVDSHCLEPGFLNYLIKFHSDTRYFKNKTGAELEIAIASWAQKMVPGRQQQVSQLWKKYKEQEDSPLSGMTLGEAKREYKRSQRNAKLNQWIRE